MPLPEPVPDLRSLDVLVSVGELGSISAAAAVHGMSQPAASMRLRALERLLRVTLLDRSTTGARLTPAGTATAEWAAGVLSSMEDLLAGTAALRASARSPLRLAASLTVAEYLVPHWLHQLSVERPDTKVSLKMGNTEHVTDLVVRGVVDLGFIEGPSRRSVHSRTLLTDELVIVVPPGHPWSRRRRGVSAREVAAAPLVLREPGSGTREVFVDALQAAGHDVTVAVELGSTTAIKAAVMAGAGSAVLSRLAVRREVAVGELVAVRCDELALRRAIRAIWTTARRPSGPAAHLLTIAASAESRPDTGAYAEAPSRR